MRRHFPFVLLQTIVFLGTFACSKPPAQSREVVYTFHHLLFKVPKGLTIGEASSGDAVAYVRSDPVIRVAVSRPSHPTKAAGTPNQALADKLMPLLRKDLIREGKTRLVRESRQFGPNRFEGFSYFSRTNDEVLDGYIVIQEHLSLCQVYFPKADGNQKTKDLSTALLSVLQEVRYEEPTNPH